MTYMLDMCSFGAPWRKRTRVTCRAPYNPPSSPPCLCRGRGGMCSYSSKRHIVLTGIDRASGMLWTRRAEPYCKRC
eukprot:7064934-Pyramimonas_sp.AAC.1